LLDDIKLNKFYVLAILYNSINNQKLNKTKLHARGTSIGNMQRVIAIGQYAYSRKRGQHQAIGYSYTLRPGQSDYLSKSLDIVIGCSSVQYAVNKIRPMPQSNTTAAAPDRVHV